jgi:hypothetical protein
MGSPLKAVSDDDWKKTPPSVRKVVIEMVENPTDGLTTIEAAARQVGRASNTIRSWITRGWIDSYPLHASPVMLVRVEEVAACSEEKPPLSVRQS